MSKRAHADEIIKWSSDKDSVVFCRSFDPTGESEWIPVPDPHWSPEVQYKTILPEYADAWQAWLDGELQVKGLSKWFTYGLCVPDFGLEPEKYRRKPKEEKEQLEQPADACKEEMERPDELTDLRKENAVLKKLLAEKFVAERDDELRSLECKLVAANATVEHWKRQAKQWKERSGK